MRRVLPIAVLAFASGCSNAPIAGFLDCVTSVHDKSDGKHAPAPAPRPPQAPDDNLPPAAADVIPSTAPRP
jgi:hypothetical protein